MEVSPCNKKSDNYSQSGVEIINLMYSKHVQCKLQRAINNDYVVIQRW